MGYINYPNNVVREFFKQASKYGVDVLCVFNYLDYINNLKLFVDVSSSAGGFVEGTLSYTGDTSDPKKFKCNIDYYIKLTRDLSDMGVHYLAVKDTADILTPCVTTMLVSALRGVLPDMPLHMTFPGSCLSPRSW